MTWEELQQAVFLNPGPMGLLRIWHLAGPSCCCKARLLAKGGAELRPEASWWPELGRCHLVAQLRSNEPYLALDRIWALLHHQPQQANTATPEGKPMTLAVKKGFRGAAELLRWHGALLLPKPANELLYEAAAAGNSRCLELLLLDTAGRPRENPWASPNARPFKTWDCRLSHGGTALDAAEVRQHHMCAELLRSCQGRHSMQRAAELALPEMLQQWLQEGADIEERDSSGATPLWLAAKGTRCTATEEERSQCIELLLAAAATVDALPITQETPLMVAAQRGSLAHCQLLLQARADVLRKDRRGKAVLEHVAQDAPLVRNLLQQAEQQATDEAAMVESEGFQQGAPGLFAELHEVHGSQSQPGRSCRSFDAYGAGSLWPVGHRAYAPSTGFGAVSPGAFSGGFSGGRRGGFPGAWQQPWNAPEHWWP